MNENESYVFSVEQPAQWSLKPEQFWITGWFVSKNGISYSDVRAFVDDVPHTGLLGLPRRDIEAAYPQWTRGQTRFFLPPRTVGRRQTHPPRNSQREQRLG